MGNSLSCLRDETYYNKDNTERQTEIIFSSKSFFNNKEEVIKIQSNWKGYKVRNQVRQYKKEITCPGVELLSDQKFRRLNEKVDKTEKILGEFIIMTQQNQEEGEEENNIYSKIKLESYNRIVYSILYSDNSIYIGTYDDNWNKHGKGTLFLPDGSKYVGEFFEDKMTGQGRIIYNDGDYYEGTFENNKPHGYGKLGKSFESLTYKGNFIRGLKTGFGTELRQDGSVYNGNFQDDMKHGKGRFSWADGTVYEGELTQNEIEGKGRIVYFDDKVYLGFWRNNKVEGKGIFSWPDGKSYVGEYKNDKKQGFGIFLFSNGKKYEGFWVNGKQHGLGLCSLKGLSRLGEWRYGKKIRWVANDVNNVKEPGVKNYIKELRRMSEECLQLCKDVGINNFEEENVKEKLCLYDIKLDNLE